MKHQFICGIAASLLVCGLFVGCRDSEATKALPVFAETSAEGIVRQLIIDDINDNLEGYAEHKVVRRGDLHFAVVSTGVLSKRTDMSDGLIEVFRRYDMLDLKYEYGPRCVAVGKPVTRRNITTAVIHYRVPVITTVKENVPGYVLCDAMPNVDVDGGIAALQAKLPEVVQDQFKLVELDSGDEQRDVFEGNVKVKWDAGKKKWVVDALPWQAGSGGEIDAEEPKWGALSEVTIDSAIRAKGFQKYNGRYVTDKALEYIKSKERGLIFRDGMWFDENYERQRIAEERLLREVLNAVKVNKTYEALANLLRQTSEVKFASDALRRECLDSIKDAMDTIIGWDLPQEQTLDDFYRLPLLRKWLANIRNDERWKRLGLETLDPILEEKIARREKRLSEDLERFKLAYGCIAAGGQRPSAAQIERLKSALMPMAQKPAYADAKRQADAYIELVKAASSTMGGNVSAVDLSKLPSSAVKRCDLCRGTGEKICPDCNNTRVCKLCGGSGIMTEDQGDSVGLARKGVHNNFKHRTLLRTHMKTNPQNRLTLICSKTCQTCSNISARKCPACNGKGHILQKNVIAESLRSQAEITREALSEIISTLTAALGKEGKGEGSKTDER